ncbi:MAG: cyclic nucleotide-binding domain-containing protein [Chitinivibrionales bacterium]|nr:cyclic nucleotide-binding domain-containing protein [Chitinivibrionales bacterium]
MRYYMAKKKKFGRGDIVFSENSECDGMYIIDSGRVRVFKTMGDPVNPREIELVTLGPGAMFGEMAMIDESKRSASVQATEPTECTVITKRMFEDQLSRIPAWMVNMIKILVVRLRETNEKLRNTVQQYTSLPNDDTGSIIAVDEDNASEIMKGSLNVDESLSSSPMGQDVTEKMESPALKRSLRKRRRGNMIIMGEMSDSDQQ